jgi:hypothetical protein
LCLIVGLMLGPFASCATTAVDRSGRPSEAADGLCFGGRPEVFLDGAYSVTFPNASGKRLVVGPGRALWQWNGFVEQIDLSTAKHEDVGGGVILKAADAHEAFVWLWTEELPGTRLSAIGPRDSEQPLRTIVQEEEGSPSPRHSNVVLDGDFIYFTSKSLPSQPGGLFRVPRYGSGDPERIADAPAGDDTPFVIERPYVYWSQHGTLSRRQLTPVGAAQQLALTKDDQVPMALHRGRLYYLDNKSLFSFPLDGSTPPAEHVTGLDAYRDATVLVDHDCLYWTTKAAIMRAKLGGPGQLEPELIADKFSYDGSPIGTDGKHLYWIDEGRRHLMRAGRSTRHLR